MAHIRIRAPRFFDQVLGQRMADLRWLDDRLQPVTSSPTSTIEGPGPERRSCNGWSAFYDEYYFRPRAAWRIVRKAMFDAKERRRLAKEAREYLALRAKRKEYALDTHP